MEWEVEKGKSIFKDITHMWKKKSYRKRTTEKKYFGRNKSQLFEN